MKTYGKGLVLASAVAGLVLSGSVSANASDKAETKTVKCAGINACSGKGECAGAGHDCGRKNECKGKGWMKTTAEECKEKGGSVVES